MIKGWKTVVFNVVTAAVGALAVMDAGAFTNDPQVLGWIIAGQSVINIILRAITNTPVGHKTA